MTQSHADTSPSRNGVFHHIQRVCRLVTHRPNRLLTRPRLHDPADGSEQIIAEDQPRNAVLVIDASPSMTSRDWKPSRLHAAQDAARAYAHRLANEEPGARVAVVAYACWTRTRCGLTVAREFDQIARAINRIHTGPCTNITAGLKAARQILDPAQRPSQVVLLSDGHHNTGPRPRSVVDALQALAIVDCVGIGGTPRDVDDVLLREIASANADGTKRYRWIGDRERLITHFHGLAGRISRG